MIDRRGPVLATLLFVLATAQSPAAASPHPPIAGEKGTRLRDFWRPPSPTQRKAERRLQDALRLVRFSLNPLSRRLSVSRPRVLRRARRMLEQLTTAHPRNARFWYWRGHAAHLVHDEGATLRAWMKVWTLDPHHWGIPDMAFSLGVILAKRGRYAESVRIYQHGMPRAPRLSTRGIMASNCAESAMATGDLKLAARLYRESLRLRPRSNSAAWWGLMVALDRQGLTWPSNRAAARALVLDPSLQGLVGRDVFFVPAGDVHYYLALAREAQGQPRRAMRQWQRYLRRQPRSRYASRARDHLRRLGRVVARFKPHTWLLRVIPPAAQPAVAGLVPRVAACYARRARRKPVPEGPLALVLQLHRGRIWRVSRGWVPYIITDVALERCVRKALRNQRLPAKGHARVFATFRLELGP